MELAEAEPDVLPAALRRSSAFLTHPVFSAHRSETAMLRYLRRLADFDIALDRSMIPLGSCTMKLNAAAEMEPISWPEFAGMHPFAPAAAGRRLPGADRVASRSGWPGSPATTRYRVQPNAGSQGELAGLLAIRAYHASRGEQHRDVCLIPESAHGTNAASAVLAGLRVVVVKCGSDGAIDLGDLRARLEAHDGHVAAIMLTYPSTAGVYEQNVSAVCAAVHEAGGQVYIDGANLNALVGVATLPSFGADVSHLNLHKTFCIPHGGGGPGVGPVAVRAHLAEFLPGRGEVGPVAAAPYGSAGILPISWAYIAMMGAAGLRRATAVAVLSANYVARRLAPHYPVLYTGRNGLVAHECVIDLRPLTRDAGVTVDDVAKRLIDYGFHAPTMSFPVAGTLMIEPTESESLDELDRFCDAMIAIRAEIARVADGEYDPARQPAEERPAHRRDAHRGGVEASLPAGGGGVPAWAWTAAPSTGRRCAGSTRPTATATWSAPALPPRPSPANRSPLSAHCPAPAGFHAPAPPARTAGAPVGTLGRRCGARRRGRRGGRGAEAEAGLAGSGREQPRPPRELARGWCYWLATGKAFRSDRCGGRLRVTTLSCS